MGFIGSNFIRFMLSEHKDIQVVNLDNLSYGSNPASLQDISNHKNYRFVKGDIRDAEVVTKIVENVDAVVNIAAETHVDRSISNPRSFVETNTMGVLTLLETCRLTDRAYLQVSTDEVYGSATDVTSFGENDRLDPSSPYAASKAAAEMLVRAYHKTYDLQTYTTRSTNNFGPYQFPEKFIPKTIIRALMQLRIPVYGSGRQVRDWIHVRDHSEALYHVLTQGRPGGVYNIAGGNQYMNLQIVELVLSVLGKPSSLIEHVGDRPGHDFRYSLDSTLITNELGWRPKMNFSQALRDTIEWYVKNEWWWKPLINEKILSPTPWKESW